ncbi:MAG: outer membrane beta-barrel protein [Chitinophagales bacterium]|nr:porin [Bacteroidota bacterium]
MTKLHLLFLGALFLTVSSVFAQTDADRIKALEENVELLKAQLGLNKVDSTVDPSAPKLTFQQKYDEKLEKIKSKIPFDLSGSVDVFVQTNFNAKQTNAVLNRAFANKANSFELGMINLMMKKKIKKVGFVADIGFGPRAETANNTLYSNTILAIKQLYVTYAPADWVEFTLGNFSTFFGYELIEPQNNFNYSTSLAFQNGPFYHTGFKANFMIKKWNIMAGFFDDNDHKSDNDRNKYVGAQVGYTSDNGGVYLNFIGGNEPTLYNINDSTVAQAYKNYKHSYDLTGSIRLGKEKKGKLGVNVAYHQYRYKELKSDKPTRNKYFTAYLYGQYDINSIASIGTRVGYFYNPDGVAPCVAGPAKHFFDFTLTTPVTIVGGLKLIPEYRFDYGSSNVFLDRKGNGSKFQNTLTLAAVYAF